MTPDTKPGSGIAKYYADKEQEARDLEERLKYARDYGAGIEVIRRLERALEQARYTGD